MPQHSRSYEQSLVHVGAHRGDHEYLTKVSIILYTNLCSRSKSRGVKSVYREDLGEFTVFSRNDTVHIVDDILRERSKLISSSTPVCIRHYLILRNEKVL